MNTDGATYVIIANPEVSTESSQNFLMSSYPQLAWPGNHPGSVSSNHFMITPRYTNVSQQVQCKYFSKMNMTKGDLYKGP